MNPWEQARTDLALQRLLEASLADPKIAKILMLHNHELFPRFDVGGQGRFTVGASGFPFLSHPIKQVRRALSRQIAKAHHFSSTQPRVETVTELQTELDSKLSPDLIAHVGLGILQVIRGQEPLRTLVAQAAEVTLNDVRRMVGTLTEDLTEPLVSNLTAFWKQAAGSQAQRSAIRSLSTNLDLYRDGIDLETSQLQILNMMIARYDLLRTELGINQGDWQECAVWLHEMEFLENAGPILMWCPDCPETGVSASIRSSLVRRRYYCPACRRPAYSASAFYPAKAFKDILETQDGLLHAAIGWLLEQFNAKPEANVTVGKFEVDFFCAPLSLLVECKMNHQVGDSTRLRSKFGNNMQQLKSHAEEALAARLPITHAISVVNSPVADLAVAVRAGFARRQSVGEVELCLLSYQELPEYLAERRLR